jgi:hypothetical protein
MSTVAGAFDETLLMNFVIRAEEMMFDDRIKQQYIPKYDALKALMSIQNARVLQPLSSRKEFAIEIEWMNTCEMSVEDNTSCEIGGTKSSTNVKEYELTYEKVVNFTVDETDFDDNRFDKEESIARQLITADKLLVENMTVRAIARLNTFLGVNALDGGKGVVAGTDTYIAAPYWNPDLFAYFNRVSVHNRFDTPTLLTGNNLYESAFLASAKAGNANGSGDARLFGTMPIYSDLFNVDDINDAAVTYMINNGALAFASKAMNPDIPEVVSGVFTRYTMRSRFVPEFVYDVYYKPECTDGDRIVHNFKVKLRADVFANPVGCTETNTGFLRFICGTNET